MNSTPSNRTGPSHDSSTVQFHGQIAELAELTPEVFEPHVGETFRVMHQQFETEQTHANPINVGPESEAAVVVELILLEVKRFPKAKELEGGFDHRAREPFSLLLEGPSHPPLMNAMLTVENDQLGRGRLFLNPVQITLQPPVAGQSASRFYEVAFN